MKFNWKVFVVAFVFSFVIPIPTYIYYYVPRWDNRGVWRPIALLSGNVITLILSPLLLFASFYLLGRNMDFLSDFPMVLVPLFVGILTGRLVGYFSLYARLYSYPFGLGSYVLQFVWFGLVLLQMAFSPEFFVGFTALTIAYTVKKRIPFKSWAAFLIAGDVFTVIASCTISFYAIIGLYGGGAITGAFFMGIFGPIAFALGLAGVIRKSFVLSIIGTCLTMIQGFIIILYQIGTYGFAGWIGGSYLGLPIILLSTLALIFLTISKAESAQLRHLPSNLS